MDSVALAGHSSNPSPVITDSQITRIMIDLYHSPAHTSLGDPDSEAMDTLPASNGDREVLPEVTPRGSSATDLSVGQNSNYYRKLLCLILIPLIRIRMLLLRHDQFSYRKLIMPQK